MLEFLPSFEYIHMHKPFSAWTHCIWIWSALPGLFLFLCSLLKACDSSHYQPQDNFYTFSLFTEGLCCDLILLSRGFFFSNYCCLWWEQETWNTVCITVLPCFGQWDLSCCERLNFCFFLFFLTSILIATTSNSIIRLFLKKTSTLSLWQWRGGQQDDCFPEVLSRICVFCHKTQQY